MIPQMIVVLSRTVADSDWCFNNLCGSLFRVKASFITLVDGNQCLLLSACKIQHTLSQKMTATVVVKCQLVLTTDQFRMPLSWTTTFHYMWILGSNHLVRSSKVELTTFLLSFIFLVKSRGVMCLFACYIPEVIAWLDEMQAIVTVWQGILSEKPALRAA